MPELPEVERGRKLAERCARGRRIVGVNVSKDEIVFEKVSPRAIKAALLGRRVEAVRRRGKHLWFELDERPYPLFHFGMTGAFRTPDNTPIKLSSSPRKRPPSTAWPPKFWKIHMTFDDGGQLVMENARRLGRIRLREDPERELPIRELGFDALDGLPALGLFTRLLIARSGNIKALLMDQSFTAGVGNWIADEVLYHAQVDPRRRANTMTALEAKRIREQLQKVLRTAVRVDAESDRFPKDWLFHQRWRPSGQLRTTRGEQIEFMKVAGRSTAWVPEVQS